MNALITPEVPFKPDFYSYPVEVKMTKTMGLGLFATRDVPRGHPLCYYDGIMTKDYKMNIVISGKHGYLQNIGDDMSDMSKTIAGFPGEYRKGGCMQLCNDVSCDLKTYENKKYWKKINTKTGKITGCETMVLFARKNIRKGDQLFYNYGRVYWESKKDDAIMYEKYVDWLFLEYNLPEKYKKKLPRGHSEADVMKRLNFISILLNLQDIEESK